MTTYAPKFNVYADDKGVATHQPGDKESPHRIMIAAGSPVSAVIADELKLRELDELSLAHNAPDPLRGLKPANISATDEKEIEKAREERAEAEPTLASAPAGNATTAPKKAHGDAK